MSKKTRYFIEPLPTGKVRTWIIKSNKNKKFLAEYPNAKEVSKTEHDKAVLTLKNNFSGNSEWLEIAIPIIKNINQQYANKTDFI